LARLTSLSVLLEDGGQAFLRELYGKVIQNVEKSTLSSLFKNRDLSGDPESGSVEVNRYQNAKSKTYGTARYLGKGDGVTRKPITVTIDVDREIVEEIENKDIKLDGLDGLLNRRSLNHIRSMVRELEKAFWFKTAVEAEVEFQPSASGLTIAQEIEEQIVALEKTQNDYVDGVDRNIMALVLDTDTYSSLRNYLDTTVNNANISTANETFGIFHGVRTYSSVYLPKGVKGLLFVEGMTAQPVLANPYVGERIGLSEAYAVSLFYHYGTGVVTPDLISAYKRQLAKPVIAISSSTLTVTAVTDATEYDVYAGLAKIATIKPVAGVITADLTDYIDEPGEYAITVVAKNPQEAYQASAKSDAKTYTVSAGTGS